MCYLFSYFFEKVTNLFFLPRQIFRFVLSILRDLQCRISSVFSWRESAETASATWLFVALADIDSAAWRAASYSLCWRREFQELCATQLERFGECYRNTHRPFDDLSLWFISIMVVLIQIITMVFFFFFFFVCFVSISKKVWRWWCSWDGSWRNQKTSCHTDAEFDRFCRAEATVDSSWRH